MEKIAAKNKLKQEKQEKQEIDDRKKKDVEKENKKRDKNGNWVFNRGYYISVFKTPDEYFIVGFGRRSVYPCDNYYKCDQWEGFLELIKDIPDRSVRL